MKRLKQKNIKRMRRYVSAVVIITIMLSIVMPENLFFLFNMRANADEGLDEPTVHADIPTYDDISFKKELYDGTGALGELPRTVQYAAGHQAVKKISLTEFIAECGTGDVFDTGKASSKMSSGYSIMICNAAELYTLSRLSNGFDGAKADERDFYLSANYILGNNIEYYDVSQSGKYFIPIGAEEHKFTGKFDGRGFEIRDLYFVSDLSVYRKAKFGMFGWIGQGGEVKNFGLYHPWIKCSISAASVGGIAAVNEGTVSDIYVIVDEYYHTQINVNKLSTSTVHISAGLIAENKATGVLRNSYFAGVIHSTDDLGIQHPVCPSNEGTIENCYYDKDVYQYGVVYAAAGNKPQIRTDNSDENTMKGISSIDLRRVGFSENGMQNTSFKALRAGKAGTSYSNTSTNSADWLYPRIYGYSGSGTEADPFIISTPAQLINFPYSFEYFSENKSYFRFDSDIDMTEVGDFIYKPQVCCDIVTSSVKPYTQGMAVNNTCAVLKEWGKSYDKGFNNNVLSGEVKDGDNNIFVHHDMGTNSDGQQMQESHIIYKLDIDTPASTPNTPSYLYVNAASGVTNGTVRAKDDYYFAGMIGYAQNSTIQNIQMIGGDFSTGDHDLLKTNADYNAYNSSAIPNTYVFTGTFAAYSRNSSFFNVHNSSVVKLGTGKQFRSAMGGIVGGGNITNASNCTNNGNVMGRYKTMTDNSQIIAESYFFGGLFGDCTVSQTHNCANHGNVMGTVLIGPSNKTLASMYTTNSYYAGVCAGRLPNSSSRNQSSNTFNDGMIFDAPIVLNENGDPLDTNGNVLSKEIKEETYDENGKPVVAPKPKAVEIEGDYTVLDYHNTNTQRSNLSDLIGISRHTPNRSCNKGKIYSVVRLKVAISGCGGRDGWTYYASNYAPLYDFSGVSQIAGISCVSNHSDWDWYGSANKCYNKGNIYVYDGGIILGGDNANDYIDYIVGTGASQSQCCFNEGHIYVAPSPSSLTRAIYVSGCGGRFGFGENYTSRNINTGKVTVDFDRYNFEFYDNNVRGVTMEGTGSRNWNANYGILEFIENKKATKDTISLFMYGCGVNSQSPYETCDYNANYADIYLDVPGKSIRNVYIRGLTFGAYNEYGMNAGNIAFRGNTTYLEISTIGLAQNGYWNRSNINLGDVRVTEDSVVKGSAYIQNIFYNSGQPAAAMNMFGYYEGCELPQGQHANVKKFLDDFKSTSYYDSEKRYGVFDISGTYGKLMVSGIYRNDYISDPTNDYKNIVNGEYNIHNVIIKHNGGISTLDVNYNYTYVSLGVFGISSARMRESKNYAPINVNNVVFDGSTPSQAVIIGGAGGNKNANYGKITVENIVTSDAATKYVPLFISGLLYNTVGSNMENHGDIDVKNFNKAVVGGTTYERASSDKTLNRVIPIVGGIGNQCNERAASAQNITDSINFGTITIDNVPVASVAGGIAGRMDAKLVECINYGLVHSRLSEINTAGGVLDLRTTYAGIVGIQGQEITNCYNFAELQLFEPTSVNVDKSSFKDDLYMGGISGKSGTMRCCQNFGDFLICPGPNTSEYSLACIGGIMGCGGDGKVNSVINYGGIYFMYPAGNPFISRYAVDKKMAYSIGGIAGIEKSTSSRASAVNYGYIHLQSGKFSDFCTTSQSNKLKGTANVDYGMYFGGLVGLDVAGGSYSYCINYGGFNDRAVFGYDQPIVQQMAANSSKHLGSLVGSVSLKSDGESHYKHNADLMVYKNNSMTQSFTLKLFGQMQNVTNPTPDDRLDPVYNYSLYKYTVDTTRSEYGSDAGNVKLITLDKSSNFDHDKNCESEGFFYGDFVFRRKLVHEESEWSFNGENLIMYTEFDNLSDYLKEYFKTRFPARDTTTPGYPFGETRYQIENMGAYVVVAGDIDYVQGEGKTGRDGDHFLPDGIIWEHTVTKKINGVDVEQLEYNFSPGITTRDDAENEILSTPITVTKSDDFASSPNLDPQNRSFSNYRGLYKIYDALLKSQGKTRTVFTDLMLFAQQVQKSTMAEVYDSHTISAMRYKNSDSRKYQYYRDYIDIVEVHPARDKFNVPGVNDDDGKVPSTTDADTGDKYVTTYDDVRYTDLFYFVAVDDLDMSANARYYISKDKYNSLAAEKKSEYTYDSSFNEYYKEVDHNGYMDFRLDNIDLSNRYSDFYVLKGDKNDSGYKNFDKVSDRETTIKNDILSIDTSEMWIKGHNVKEKLEDTSLWYHFKNGRLADDSRDRTDDEIWKISVPIDITTNPDGETILNTSKNVYTKVFGVQLSEDGKHYNIIRLNVIVDYYKPSALVEAVGIHADNFVNNNNTGYYYSTNSTDSTARTSDVFTRTNQTKRVPEMERFLDNYYSGKYDENGHKVNGAGVIVDDPSDTANYNANFGMKKGIGANNGLLAVKGMPSLTDTDFVYDEHGNVVLNDDNTEKEVQRNDVTYYFLSNDIMAKKDDVQNVPEGTVNIQHSTVSFSNNNNRSKAVEIWLSTKNMVDYSAAHHTSYDQNNNQQYDDSNIWAHVSYQDRVPYLEGYDYNQWLKENVEPDSKHSVLASQLNDDTLWNDAATLNDLDESADLKDISPEGTGRGYKLKKLRSQLNVEDDATKQSTGYAKISLSDAFGGDIYYGGLYRVDLFYERSKDEGWPSAKHFATVFFWKEFESENAQYFAHYNTRNEDYYENRYNWMGDLGNGNISNKYRNTANATGGYSSGYAAAYTTYYNFSTAFVSDAFITKSGASYLSNMNEKLKGRSEGLMFAAPSRQREVNDWAIYTYNRIVSTYSPKAYGSSRRVLLDGGKDNTIVYDGYKTTASDGRLVYNEYKTEKHNNQETLYDVYDKVKRDPIFNHVLTDDDGYAIYDDTSDRVYDKDSGVVYNDSDNKGTITVIGEEYKVNKDSKQSSKVKTLSMKTEMNRIDVKIDETTGDFYPASYHWQGAVTSEDTKNTNIVDYEVINGGYDSYDGSWNRGNLASINIVSGSTKKDGFTVTDGKGEIEGDERESPTFNVQWSSSNVRDYGNKVMYANGGSTYNPSIFNYSEADAEVIKALFKKDGFGATVTHGNIVRTDNNGNEIPFKIRVYYKSVTDSDYTLMTDAEIEKRVDTISYDNNNNWTFKLNKYAPCGSYKFIPYFSYHTDLKMTVDNDKTISLVKYDPKPSVESSEANKIAASDYTDGTGAAKNVFEWTIAYSPFVIESYPNDESYLLEADVDNDNGMPVIYEDDAMAKTIPQSSQRDTYIIMSDEHNEIHYVGYENYETGDNRIDKFDITAFVGKDDITGKPIDHSSLTFKAPYMATVEVWDPAYGESPIDANTGQFDRDNSHWINMSDKIDDSFGEENEEYKHYSLVDEDFNHTFDDDPDIKYYTKYYRVVAEDKETMTLYKVSIVPSKRNKRISFEVATDAEKDISQELRDNNDPIVAEYEESAKVYDELMQSYEQIFATIKELRLNSDNTIKVENYETKWFDGNTPDELKGTSPYIYNLKAHLYDISTSLPAGYTYDVYLVAPAGDSYMKLLDSGHGMTGKRFIMGNPDAQDLKIRIVLKYEKETIWGVNYLWTPDSAKLEERNGKKYVSVDGGGLLNNYVYSQRSTS